MKNKLTKQQWIFILISIVVIITSFFAGGYFLNNKPITSSQKESVHKPVKNDIFTSKMLNDEKTLIAAIAWYGYAKHQEPDWYAWKDSKSVDHMDLNHMSFQPRLEGKSNNQYYQYQSDKKQKTVCGFKSSIDHKTYYLYTFKPNQKSDVAPLMVVRRDDLVNDINKNKAKEEILNYSASISLSVVRQQKVKKVVEKIERVKKVTDDDSANGSQGLKMDTFWSAEQKAALSDAMDAWGVEHEATYSEVNLDYGNNVVPFVGVTLKNQLENSEDALLSIDAQFEAVNTSIEKSDDRDYHIVAAFNGTSRNVKNMRYLFVIKDNKPQVLKSNISISIGDPNGKRAANFVPTTDKDLLTAFKKIYYNTSVSSEPSVERSKDIYIEDESEEVRQKPRETIVEEEEEHITRTKSKQSVDTSEEIIEESTTSDDPNTTVVTEEEIVEETTINR